VEAISAALGCPPLATCVRVNTLRTTRESLLERLPSQLSAEDAALLAAGAPPYPHPLVPCAVIVPGSGPHAVDYSRCGAL
jgi:hypothetical protein